MSIEEMLKELVDRKYKYVMECNVPNKHYNDCCENSIGLRLYECFESSRNICKGDMLKMYTKIYKNESKQTSLFEVVDVVIDIDDDDIFLECRFIDRD